MIRLIVACMIVAILSGSAWALDDDPPDKRPSYTDKRASSTQGPDMMDNSEYFAVKGAIIDRVATRDTDKFERDITRVGLMVYYESPYKFFAVGAGRDEFRQGSWSTNVDSILLAGRNTNRRTGEGINGRLGVTTNTGKVEFHGEGTWNFRFTEKAGAELIGSRDAVETIGALKQAILSNFVAVSIDYALTDRLTVIGMPTYQRFTDGNDRRGGRAWLIYSLLPEYGIGVEAKVQAYGSTGNSGGLYFNPEQYERYEIGLRLRRAIGDWRVIASADYGRERINREIEKPTYAVALTMQRSFSNNVAAGIQFSYYRAASEGSDINSSDDYAWGMGRIYLAIPF